MPSFDMLRVRNIHLIGVGGCGMSGIARILHEMGYKVSGSDIKEGPNTVRLKDLGVKIHIGHDSSQVREADIVVYSSAVSGENPEMAEARAKGILILKRAEMLAWIMGQSQNRIAIAGTHGKTTTTAMAAKIFDAADLQPTFLIGCDMDYVEGNARYGNGHYAIAEADESDRSFLHLSPTVEILTNVEADHLEHYGNMDELIRTFDEFIHRLSPEGFIVIDGTDPNNQKLMKNNPGRYITYGLGPSMEYSARGIKFSNYRSSYILLHREKEMGAVELLVPGKQNILDSLAAFALSLEFKLDFNQVAGALRNFVGARRRFSTVGEMNGILIIDDYAHHPTEVRATLAAARSGWPEKRVICVFQPHRYTRTLLLKDDFAGAFGDADKVIITDVYAASENPIPGISGKTIADLLDPEKTSYIPKKEMIAGELINELQEGDIVLTLGAGDVFTVGKEILSRLKMHEIPAQ